MALGLRVLRSGGDAPLNKTQISDLGLTLVCLLALILILASADDPAALLLGWSALVLVAVVEFWDQRKGRTLGR
jgi:hypothetical protein